MAVAALVVSIIAAALSAVSIGWQVYSWRHTGPVIKLRTRWAVGVGALENERMIVIEAYNSGRSPVRITQWSLDMPNGKQLVTLQAHPASTPLSEPVDGGSDAQWFMDAEAVKEDCRQHGVRVEDLRARVTLGNGSYSRARRKGIGKTR